MKNLLLIAALFFVCRAVHAQSADTFEVYFNLGEAAIVKKSGGYLRQLVLDKKLVPGQRMAIMGYADYLGTDSLNDILSQNRAKNVKDYLVASGFRADDIILCMGKGAINHDEKTKEGRPEDRKAQIVAWSADGPVNIDTNALFRIDTLDVDDVVPLDHVHFEMGKTWIWPDKTDSAAARSYEELDKVVAFLENYYTITVRIEGHLCCPVRGDDPQKSQIMSKERAYTVMNYLTSKGIAKNRLSVIGYGATNPFVHPERTPEDEALNRRVAIRIMSK